MQKTQFSSGDLLLNKKQVQKKPFVLLHVSVISHVITLLSYMYCSFVNAKQAKCKMFVNAKQAGDRRSSAGYLIVCRRLLWS